RAGDGHGRTLRRPRRQREPRRRGAAGRQRRLARRPPGADPVAPHAPARVELTAGVRCAEPPNACAVRARLTYDTTALEAGALGAPLTFTDGSVRLPGWLELDAQDDGTVARLLTANHRPEAPAGQIGRAHV